VKVTHVLASIFGGVLILSRLSDCLLSINFS